MNDEDYWKRIDWFVGNNDANLSEIIKGELPPVPSPALICTLMYFLTEKIQKYDRTFATAAKWLPPVFMQRPNSQGRDLRGEARRHKQCVIPVVYETPDSRARLYKHDVVGTLWFEDGHGTLILPDPDPGELLEMNLKETLLRNWEVNLNHVSRFTVPAELSPSWWTLFYLFRRMKARSWLDVENASDSTERPQEVQTDRRLYDVVFCIFALMADCVKNISSQDYQSFFITGQMRTQLNLKEFVALKKNYLDKCQLGTDSNKFMKYLATFGDTRKTAGSFANELGTFSKGLITLNDFDDEEVKKRWAAFLPLNPKAAGFPQYRQNKL